MGNNSCTICEDSASINGRRKLDQASTKIDEPSKIKPFQEDSR